MSVPTTSDAVDVDLDLTTEDVEPCYCCELESVGYIKYTNTCTCKFPNPAPLCTAHIEMAEDYVRIYGPDHWECIKCGDLASVEQIYYRKR